jgi:hypothetical protein
MQDERLDLTSVSVPARQAPARHRRECAHRPCAAPSPRGLSSPPLPVQDLVPPRAIQVQVRALQDCGQVMTSRGAEDLRRGQTVKMLAVDAELLIRRGWLVQVDEDI